MLKRKRNKENQANKQASNQMYEQNLSHRIKEF